jgi:hypothetical protein
VLQVSVHHRNIASVCCKDAFQTGAGQSAAPDPTNGPNPMVRSAYFTDQCSSSVGGIIVDKQNLPIVTAQHGSEPLDQRPHVFPFIEGRNDESEFGRWPNCLGA